MTFFSHQAVSYTAKLSLLATFVFGVTQASASFNQAYFFVRLEAESEAGATLKTELTRTQPWVWKAVTVARLGEPTGAAVPEDNLSISDLEGDFTPSAEDPASGSLFDDNKPSIIGETFGENFDEADF